MLVEVYIIKMYSKHAVVSINHVKSRCDYAPVYPVPTEAKGGKLITQNLSYKQLSVTLWVLEIRMSTVMLNRSMDVISLPSIRLREKASGLTIRLGRMQSTSSLQDLIEEPVFEPHEVHGKDIMTAKFHAEQKMNLYENIT
ncbi:hypothetical protein STEG23_015446 [Scotinomys teguina]